MCIRDRDLQLFVQNNSGEEARRSLKFRPQFAEYARKKRERAVEIRGVPVEDMTFVGIHNRRTVNRSIYILFTVLLGQPCMRLSGLHSVHG